MKVTIKDTNINNLTTVEIARYVIYRHRVILLIVSNVSTLTYIFVQQAPIVAHNLGA